jgi:hypothetical protein
VLRGAVYGFLAAFLACGFFTIELWPLTGFELYSEVRVEERRSEALVVELADGREKRVNFDELPFAWHATNRIASDFDEMTQAERDEVCDAWVQPLRDDGLDIVGIRIDEVVAHLADPDRPTESAGVLYRCDP